MNYQIPSLQGMYLLSLCAVMKTDNLDAMIHDNENGTGRLYFCPTNTTVPEMIVQFAFTEEDVKLGVLTRSGQKKQFVVSYVEGIDATLKQIVKLIRAGRLEAKAA